MTLTHTIVTSSIKVLTHILCRVDGTQLPNVPDRGPLIIYGNHVNFLEGPLLYAQLQPRPMFGFVKAETWDNPFLGWLADLWQAIPLRRDEIDLTALRQALGVLEAGHILGVAPEGTRSGDGCLLRGNPGIVMLALRSGAPLLPLASYGGERFWQNLSRLRRTDYCAVVGQPFSLDPAGCKVTRDRRQQMTDEIMYQLAALLPPEYRGVYSDLRAASESYLRFPPGAHSNLLRA